MPSLKNQIPNLITLLNLFFGCWAIVYVFQAGAMASIDETGGMICCQQRSSLCAEAKVIEKKWQGDYSVHD